jgi:hypothetical protein
MSRQFFLEEQFADSRNAILQTDRYPPIWVQVSEHDGSVILELGQAGNFLSIEPVDAQKLISALQEALASAKS